MRPGARKGRGATCNPDVRYAEHAREAFDDGWGTLEGEPGPVPTRLFIDRARRVIARNDSPDVPFRQSVNPYRGCEHGCVYCFARPTHAYLGHSPGLDFETLIYHKPDAPERLREELARPGYRCSPIALGINTDAYQPVERRTGLTRRIIEVLLDARHPFTIVTKSALVERDLDLLAEAARQDLVHVMISLTTLDDDLARRLEPRAARPARRLRALERLAEAGVPCGVLVAPVIPVLTDPELERLLGAAREHGARAAGYVLLRLSLELKELVEDWLDHHRPGMKDHVLNRLREAHGGRLYDARHGHRMRGAGPYAELIRQRFRLAHKRLGFGELPPLEVGRFRAPGDQLDLFS